LGLGSIGDVEVGRECYVRGLEAEGRAVRGLRESEEKDCKDVKEKLRVLLVGRCGIDFLKESKRTEVKMDPRRKELILEFVDTCLRDVNSSKGAKKAFVPVVQQKKSRKLIGLKPITLQEIVQSKNQDYTGYLLQVTCLGYTTGQTLPAIQILVQDSDKTTERILISNLDMPFAKIKQKFRFGAKLSILHPSFKPLPPDSKPSIFIEDPFTIIDDDFDDNFCFVCSCSKSTLRCPNCKAIKYCSSECKCQNEGPLNHSKICPYLSL